MTLRSWMQRLEKLVWKCIVTIQGEHKLETNQLSTKGRTDNDSIYRTELHIAVKTS